MGFLGAHWKATEIVAEAQAEETVQWEGLHAKYDSLKDSEWLEEPIVAKGDIGIEETWLKIVQIGDPY